MTHPLEGIAPLPHLGVIRAQGDDAASFLHNQLTQDFLLLQPGQARLAAFCSAKGRMQASFVGLTLAPNDIALIVSRDLLAPTLKRLSMFVLRAKVKLSDASEAFVLRGLAGQAAIPAGASALAPWAHAQQAGAHWVGLYPADGQARALWLAPAGTPAAVVSRLNATIVKVLAQADIRKKISDQGAEVYSETPEQFASFIQAEGVKWGKVVRESGARVE